MIYYSDGARGTALDNILRLREIVASVPGDALSFGDAQDIGHYLGVLADAIRNEQRGIEIERIKRRHR